MTVQQTFGVSRNVPWAPPLTYSYTGGLLPAIGHVAMQLRLYPGAADPALISLAAIPFSQAATPTATDATFSTLTLSPSITVAQLQALPALSAAQVAELAVLAQLPTPEPTDIETAQCFAFDIVITYADGVSEILSSGSFIVSPGVTTI